MAQHHSHVPNHQAVPCAECSTKDRTEVALFRSKNMAGAPPRNGAARTIARKVSLLASLWFVIAGASLEQMARAGGSGTLALNPSDVCLGIDETLTVTVDLTDADMPVEAAQFFLEYDAALDFVSIESVDAPFTLVLSATIDETARTIDYAVSVPVSESGVATGTLATITFQTVSAACLNSLVWFLPDHDPPILLSGKFGIEVVVALADLPPVTVGTGPIIIGAPADISVECDSVPAPLASLPAFDSCDTTVTQAFFDGESVTPGTCQHEFTLTRTWTTPTNFCGEAAVATQVVSVHDSTTPTLTCPVDVELICGKPIDPSVTGTATAVDNCDADPAVSFIDDDVPGDCSVGVTITRTWRASDACGNQATCNQAITLLAPAAASLTLNTDETCFALGQAITVRVDMSNALAVIVLGQFFLQYDPLVVDLVSVEPGDPPFTLELSSAIDEIAGTIDYAVGVPPGDSGTVDDTAMAVITFATLQELCTPTALISFRPHVPPSRLSDENGAIVNVSLTDLVIDPTGSPPQVLNFALSAGSVDQDCEFPALFSATVSNACCVNASDVTVSITVPSGNADATESVTITQLDSTTVEVSGTVTVTNLTGCAALLEVTISAVDCCGLAGGQAVQTAEILDATPPELICPSDILVFQPPGECLGARVVDFSPPTASDNCDPSPLVSCSHSSGELFPIGTTAVSCSAIDACGNEAMCAFDVTVSTLNEVQVQVQLDGVVAPGPFTRCVRFELWNCDIDDTAPLAVVDEVLTFTDGLAFDSLGVPCGIFYTCITANDELHTLRRTITPIGFDAEAFFVEFVDSDGTDLVGGDLDNSGQVNILDFGVFVSQFGTNFGSGDTTCTTVDPHSDINGDGLVDNVDFTFILTGFIEQSDPNCCGTPLVMPKADEPFERISVKELYRRGLAHLAVADLNGDGWVDTSDMAAFAQGARPSRDSHRIKMRDGDLPPGGRDDARDRLED